MFLVDFTVGRTYFKLRPGHAGAAVDMNKAEVMWNMPAFTGLGISPIPTSNFDI